MNSNSNRWAGLGAATPLWLLAGQCLQSPASVGGADCRPWLQQMIYHQVSIVPDVYSTERPSSESGAR